MARPWLKAKGWVVGPLDHETVPNIFTYHKKACKIHLSQCLGSTGLIWHLWNQLFFSPKCVLIKVNFFWFFWFFWSSENQKSKYEKISKESKVLILSKGLSLINLKDSRFKHQMKPEISIEKTGSLCRIFTVFFALMFPFCNLCLAYNI